MTELESLFLIMALLALWAFFIGFFYACANIDNSIGRDGKPKTVGTFLYLWLKCGGYLTLFLWIGLGIFLFAAWLSMPYCVVGV